MCDINIVEQFFRCCDKHKNIVRYRRVIYAFLECQSYYSMKMFYHYFLPFPTHFTVCGFVKVVVISIMFVVGSCTAFNIPFNLLRALIFADYCR